MVFNIQCCCWCDIMKVRWDPGSRDPICFPIGQYFHWAAAQEFKPVSSSLHSYTDHPWTTITHYGFHLTTRLNIQAVWSCLCCPKILIIIGYNKNTIIYLQRSPKCIVVAMAKKCVTPLFFTLASQKQGYEEWHQHPVAHVWGHRTVSVCPHLPKPSVLCEWVSLTCSVSRKTGRLNLSTVVIVGTQTFKVM